MINIKCFGIAKEIVGNDVAFIDSSTISVADLRQRMNEQYKAFTQIKGYMVAVNQEYAIDSQIINADDEVAIIPPVSGG
ncbi:MoaD/ThiS family protein [Saprospiraceae bacterium]|jgi:molybdopterin synthase sulfur carrier subunit|nr:MoaD/ThiS family protein [Saprospiraceae bacterium]|tara:strand:+ start:551 stop:787 length:237 start_codon:yes stop_codon:yes gene_type:complete